jgi:hypothetical protein
MPDIESKSSGVSNSSSVSSAPDAPGTTALHRPPDTGPPPTTSTSMRTLIPNGSSYTPGRRTSPLSVNTVVPGEVSVPEKRNQSAPRRRMPGRCARVSTLCTTAGSPA